MSVKTDASDSVAEPSLFEVFGSNISEQVHAVNQRAAELSMDDMARVMGQVDYTVIDSLETFNMGRQAQEGGRSLFIHKLAESGRSMQCNGQHSVYKALYEYEADLSEQFIALGTLRNARYAPEVKNHDLRTKESLFIALATDMNLHSSVGRGNYGQIFGSEAVQKNNTKETSTHSFSHMIQYHAAKK